MASHTADPIGVPEIVVDPTDQAESARRLDRSSSVLEAVEVAGVPGNFEVAGLPDRPRAPAPPATRRPPPGSVEVADRAAQPAGVRRHHRPRRTGPRRARAAVTAVGLIAVAGLVRSRSSGRHSLDASGRFAARSGQPRATPRAAPRVGRHGRDAGRHAVRGTGHRFVLALAAAGLVAVAFVLTTTGVIGGSSSVVPATLLADPSARQQAADRADRAARQAPGAALPTAPTPTPAIRPTPKPAPAWVNPLPGAVITSCFGARWGALHQGIDFAMPEGTPILAVGAGIVVGAGWLYAGYGMSVMIDHGNGYLSHYAHAERILVSVGQRVRAGQRIALEGATGDATGPHLHFEVHRGLWQQINPAPWLRARGVPVGC